MEHQTKLIDSTFQRYMDDSLVSKNIHRFHCMVARITKLGFQVHGST